MNDLIYYENGLVLLLGKYIFELRLGLLLVILAAATVYDVRYNRVPNRLVIVGALMAIGYHVLLPYGMGGSYTLAGLGVGLGLFLPFYMLRAMGAGDVKLMAVVGAFLGPLATVDVVLVTLVLGGVLAVAVSVAKRTLGQAMANLWIMLNTRSLALTDGATSVAQESAGTLPYAVAIMGGTASYLLLAHFGRTLFS